MKADHVPTPTAADSERGQAWTVVGLGDSVTSGHGCRCRELVGAYADLTAAATGRRVRPVNLGRDGSTSADLLADLNDEQSVRAAVSGADVIIIITGANDLQPQLAEWSAGRCPDLTCFDGAVPQVQKRMSAILASVRALRSGRPTEILLPTYWNVFQDGEVARNRGNDYQAMSRAVTQRVAAAECAVAAEARVDCVDLVPVFRGRKGERDATSLLQGDGDHPNQAGHTAIARALAAEGWPSLYGKDRSG